MIVKVSDIAARCVLCRRHEFEPSSVKPLKARSVLRCTGCGARYTYVQLIDQIGEEAMRRANKALDEVLHARRAYLRAG